MKYLISTLFLIIILLGFDAYAAERYHILEFTASDPMIKERCVDFNKIQKLNCGFVKETYTSSPRFIKLEFYRSKDEFYGMADFPSIVTYKWEKDILVETLYESDGSLFSPEYMVRPNKVEYLLMNSYKVIEMRDYYNNKFVRSTKCKNDCSIDNSVFFLIYSGCKLKSNKNYGMEF